MSKTKRKIKDTIVSSISMEFLICYGE